VTLTVHRQVALVFRHADILRCRLVPNDTLEESCKVMASPHPAHVDYEFEDDHPKHGHLLYRLERRGKSLVLSRNGKDVTEPQIHKKLELLEYFLNHPNETLSNQEIVVALWGAAGGYLEKLVSQLRTILLEESRKWRIIEKRGKQGLRFCGKNVRVSVNDSTELSGAIPLRLSSNLVEGVSALHPSPTLLDRFASVPSPAPHFLDRPDILEPLRERILSRAPTVALTAVEGMGGIGKTTIAIHLCHDPLIREAFPDGIVWLRIGKESRAILEPGETLKEHRIKRVAHYLNQEFDVYDEAAYRTMLEGKAVLVVLDDVWTLEDVEPFRIAGGRSCLLYTTRDRSLAGSLGALQQEVGTLDTTESRELLALWSQRPSTTLPEPHASQILNQCAGLALGISMIGAALVGQSDDEWRHRLEDLKEARLKYIDRRPADYAYETLHACIAVSVNALAPDIKSLYLRLAVLLEDMPAPQEFLRALWGGEEHVVHRTARLLVERSLARRDADGIRLHDLQLDYIRGEHSHPHSLRLQHSALRLSAHILRRSPEQFAAQMIGRLVSYSEQTGINEFVQCLLANSPRPFLRPLTGMVASAGGPAVRVLEGHTDRICTAAMSEDGQYAYSSSADNTLRVWDLENNEPPIVYEGQIVTNILVTANDRWVLSRSSNDFTLVVADPSESMPRILTGHEAEITAIAASRDGKSAITASRDKTLRVWDLDLGTTARILRDHSEAVTSVAMTPDGSRAVSASRDGTLRIWDLRGLEPPRILKPHHSHNVVALSITAQCDRVLSVSSLGDLWLWDLTEEPAPRIMAGSRGWGTLTVTGEYAFFISYDGTTSVWNLEEQCLARTLKTRVPKLICVRAAGRRAVVQLDDGSAWLLDLVEDRLHHRCLHESVPEHESRLFPAAVAKDAKIAVFSSGVKAEVWNLETHQLMRVLDGFSESYGSICSVAVSADGNRILASTANGLVLLWDSEYSQPGALLVGGWCKPDDPQLPDGYALFAPAVAPPHFNTEVAISADGTISAAYDGDKLRAWNYPEGLEEKVLEGHRGVFKAMALTADGRFLVAVTDSSDDTANLRVWDLQGDTQSRVIGHEIGNIEALTLTEDGTRAVTIDRDGTLRSWDLQGNLPSRAWGNYGSITSVAMTPDGRRAVTGAGESVLVWELDSFEPPRALVGHRSFVSAVAITADGSRAISGSDDQTLRVWNLHAPIEGVEGHADIVSTVAVSEDGKRAVSGSLDGTLRLWVPDGDRSVSVTLGHTDNIDVVAVARDGKYAISGSRDGGLRVWDLEIKGGPRLLGEHADWVSAIAISRDGRRAVSGSRDGALVLWDLAAAGAPQRLGDDVYMIQSLAVTAAGDRALCYTGDGRLTLWDIENKRVLRALDDMAVSSPSTVIGGKQFYLPIVRFQDVPSGKFRIVCGYPGGLQISALLGSWFFSGHDEIDWSRASSQIPLHRKHFALGRGGGASKISEGTPEAAEAWFYLADDNIDWSIEAFDTCSDGKHAVSAHGAMLRVWDLDARRCSATFTCDALISCCAWQGNLIAAGDHSGHVHLLSFEE
jgi:WD40 repeat protein/DNA-binding winged helix-turn-helix (wHTH) protein